LLATNVEQITVVRMFIRSFGLTFKHVDDWMGKQLAEEAAEVSQKKLKHQ